MQKCESFRIEFVVSLLCMLLLEPTLILYHKILVCEEKRMDVPVKNFSKPLDHAAFYNNTNTSLRTIKNINQKYSKSSNNDTLKKVKISTPNEHRKKSSFTT